MEETFNIKDNSSVEKYDGLIYQLQKLHMHLIFQAREVWNIVSRVLKKDDAKDKVMWEGKDKSGAVAIMGVINRQHKEEFINCTTSAEMWTTLTTYHQQHSEECITSF